MGVVVVGHGGGTVVAVMVGVVVRRRGQSRGPAEVRAVRQMHPPLLGGGTQRALDCPGKARSVHVEVGVHLPHHALQRQEGADQQDDVGRRVHLPKVAHVACARKISITMYTHGVTTYPCDSYQLVTSARRSPWSPRTIESAPKREPPPGHASIRSLSSFAMISTRSSPSATGRAGRKVGGVFYYVYDTGRGRRGGGGRSGGSYDFTFVVEDPDANALTHSYTHVLVHLFLFYEETPRSFAKK